MHRKQPWALSVHCTGNHWAVPDGEETSFSVCLLNENLINLFPVLHYLNIYKLLLNLGWNMNIWEFLSLTEVCLKDYRLYSGV